MEKFIFDHIREYAEENPGRLALCERNYSLSYGQLDRITDGLAAEIIKSGVKKQDAVGVLLSSPLRTLVSAIAIYKSGCVFVPVGEKYPTERISYMLKDSASSLIISEKALFEDKKPCFENRLYLKNLDEYITDEKFTPCDLSFEDHAFMLYTSGTTGNPKGVMHTHHSLSVMHKLNEGYPRAMFNKSSRIGLMADYTFIAGAWNSYGALMCGACIYYACDEEKQNISLLYKFLTDNKITHIFMPPGLVTEMVESLDTGSVCFFSGGEKLRNFTPKSADSCVFNCYGSTELAAISIIPMHGDEYILSVGRPAEGYHAHIMNENGDELPAGEIGELWIETDYTVSQYRNLPQQNLEKWVKLNGNPCFKTGDRVKKDENGLLYIYGRCDNMVKIRGYRVESGEIEHQISAALSKYDYPQIQIAVAMRTINGIDHLIAYYESENVIDLSLIIAEIKLHLAEYMLPDIYMNVAKFPLNARGKVVRRELPMPEASFKSLSPINSETELRIAEGVYRVLNLVQGIDLNESFVSLGGDSLKAMKLAGMLSAQGIKIDGAEILAADTLRDIGEAAEIKYEELWTADEYENIKEAYLKRGERIQKVLPITPEQDDMLCQWLIFPDIPIRRKIVPLSFGEHLDKSRIRASLWEISEKHEFLRAYIPYRDVSLFQSVITDCELKLHFVDKKNLGGIMTDIENTFFDPELSPILEVYYAYNSDGGTNLYFAINELYGDYAHTRPFIIDFLRSLVSFYPSDDEMADMLALLESAADSESAADAESAVDAGEENKNTNSKPFDIASIQDEIFVYSSKPERKMFFVHTGNTGSSAYYRLAQHIKNDVSFMVLEPHNLYHSDCVIHGIKNIAKKYIETIKKVQPEGPYLLGGWCYGGIVAYEMACQLEAAGEKVDHLFLYDAHAASSAQASALARKMLADTDRKYYETSPLFSDLREKGLLEAVITNSMIVREDIADYKPSYYNGEITYFKPTGIPSDAVGDSKKYWEYMKENYIAGNFENYINKDKLHVYITPLEHDLMMSEESLKEILPVMYDILNPHK